MCLRVRVTPDRAGLPVAHHDAGQARTARRVRLSFRSTALELVVKGNPATAVDRKGLGSLVLNGAGCRGGHGDGEGRCGDTRGQALINHAQDSSLGDVSRSVELRWRPGGRHAALTVSSRQLVSTVR